MAVKKYKPTKSTKTVKNEKKTTTSKKIVFVSYAIGGILSALLVWFTYSGYDVSGLSIITAAALAEITTSNAFYFWKAKRENTMKIALSAVKETPSDQVDDIVKLINAMGGIV